MAHAFESTLEGELTREERLGVMRKYLKMAGIRLEAIDDPGLVADLVDESYTNYLVLSTFLSAVQKGVKDTRVS